MTPHQLETIHSNLLVAKSILYTPEGKVTDNPMLLNHAAYHSAQAIEVSLKSLIIEYGAMDRRLANTHNTEALLIAVGRNDPNFIMEHPYLSNSAHFLRCANSLRYMDEQIGKTDTLIMYKEARNLYNELEMEYGERGQYGKALAEHKCRPNIVYNHTDY